MVVEGGTRLDTEKLIIFFFPLAAFLKGKTAFLEVRNDG